MVEIKEFRCDSVTPADSEIRQCIEIATAKHCIVRLCWNYPFSGTYSLDVKPGMTYDGCIDMMPKIYPL